MYLVNLKRLFTEPTSHFKAFLLFDYTWLISSETRLDECTKHRKYTRTGNTGRRFKNARTVKLGR